jgi:hypothetical protein
MAWVALQDRSSFQEQPYDFVDIQLAESDVAFPPHLKP